MPHNYEQTLGRLQNFINDDQMCAVLSCNSFSVANKLILDCLVERMKFEEDLFDFCDRLEMITGSQDLNIIISEIRSGKSNLHRAHIILFCDYGPSVKTSLIANLQALRNACLKYLRCYCLSMVGIYCTKYSSRHMIMCHAVQEASASHQCIIDGKNNNVIFTHMHICNSVLYCFN